LGSRRLVQACFKLEEELLAEVDRLAEREGVERSAVLRRAVRRYLESLKPAVTPRMAVYDVRGGDGGGRRMRVR
jgi:metal-responsive CopG/Arc/MetJ family transcriptional regulator